MSTVYNKLSRIDELLEIEKFCTDELKKSDYFTYFYDDGWRVSTKSLISVGVDISCIDAYIRMLLKNRKVELEKALAKTLCDRIE